MYLNKAFIFGNLTRDPELKALPSGTKVTEFSLATNRVWVKDGKRQEDAEYHNVVVFGRQAETSAQYLKKGASALVEGRIRTRSWEGTDGQKRYRTELVADNVQFGPRVATDASSKETADEKAQRPTDEDMAGIEYPAEEISPDDIPF